MRKIIVPIKNPEKRICKTCGREFVPNKSSHTRQISCTTTCWQDHYNEEHKIARRLREQRRKAKID
jgi:hypothetical protein